MKQLRTLYLRIFTLLCFLALSFTSFSQGTITPRPNVAGFSANSNGYYEFLPSDYNSNTNTYPLILFLSGFGAVGNGSSTDLAKILEDGPFYYLNEYQVNGVDFPARASINKAIMICPQWINWDASPQHVNEVLNYIFLNYRVNPNKVYLTGLSSGGGVAYNYAASSLINARRVTAMVNFAPGTAAPFDVTGPTQAKGDIIAQADIALWAFHFSNDNLIPISTTSAQWVQYTNNPTPPIPPPTPLARTTFPTSTIPNDQHSIWPSVYRGSNTIFQAPSTSALLDGMNMYEWLYQFSRVGNSVLPVRFGTFITFN
jgi:predicted peptidase